MGAWGSAMRLEVFVAAAEDGQQDGKGPGARRRLAGRIAGGGAGLPDRVLHPVGKTLIRPLWPIRGSARREPPRRVARGAKRRMYRFTACGVMNQRPEAGHTDLPQSLAVTLDGPCVHLLFLKDTVRGKRLKPQIQTTMGPSRSSTVLMPKCSTRPFQWLPSW